MPLKKRSLNSIKESLNGLSVKTLASRATFLALSFVLLGCVSRKDVQNDIDANVFLIDRIPTKLCTQTPELRGLGIYRKLNNGQEEFVSFCKNEITLYMVFYSKDVERVLDKYFERKAK